MFTRLILALPLLASPLLANEWPQFRGPNGDGHAPAKNVPQAWSETSGVAWKTPIPGRGWSTPVVGDGQVWLTSATEDGKEMTIYCLDQGTGEIRHQEVVFRNEKPEPLGNPVNGYASPSGYWEKGSVWLHFGSYGTLCLDTKTFQKKWVRTDLPCRHYRGPGSSLTAYKNMLILSMDGVDVQYMVALDKATGKEIWKTDRSAEWNDLGADGKPKMEGDMRKAYCTPLLAKVGNGNQWISTGSKASYGYDAETGKEIWKITYDGFSNASSPVTLDGQVFLNTGYGKAVVIAVPLNAATKGDVTAQATWSQKKRMPLRSSPLALDGKIYCAADDGQFSALDAKTGEPVWSERIEGNYSGSPILVEGKLLLCNEQGKSFWVKPGDKLEIVGENTLAEGMLASPVAIDGNLILRTKGHVYRIGAK
jgi:outer membrane protein assembly factor BamB